MLKRYARNRQIYDTDIGRYVSVSKSRERLLAGERIFDHVDTSKDVTVLCMLALLREDIERGSGPTVEAMRELLLSYCERVGGQ